MNVIDTQTYLALLKKYISFEVGGSCNEKSYGIPNTRSQKPLIFNDR